jgi:hypothetical protein
LIDDYIERLHDCRQGSKMIQADIFAESCCYSSEQGRRHTRNLESASEQISSWEQTYYGIQDVTELLSWISLFATQYLYLNTCW